MRLPLPSQIVLAVSFAVVGVGAPSTGKEPSGTNTIDGLLAGDLHWSVSEPLVAVDNDRLPNSPDNPWIAVKDPTIVRFGGRWHLFCSLRKQKGGLGRIRIGYLSFEEWADAPAANWRLLNLTDDYHGAPQVFYFEPQRKWYLVYQAADNSRGLGYGPCYSTTDDLCDSDSWTPPAALYKVKEGRKAGLDFWVICDDARAHLFFTTLDGRMWRTETPLADFPDRGWKEPEVALQADVFEASHTYHLAGVDKYLTLIEAEDGPRRYYKAFVAEQLIGPWHPIAATKQHPFASPVNVRNQNRSWTTSYSHGELIRSGVDQRLEVDPSNLQFVFQGVSDDDRRGKDYGSIPWRLGMLQ